MSKSWIIVSLLGLLSFSPVLAYESPGSPTGFVNDYAEILTVEEEATLASKLTALSDSDGSEMVIVTIPSLGDESIENFAVNLFSEWKIGQADKDNGLLLLIALEDRAMRLEVGYGLEGTITDALSYWIINDVITPAFKKGEYFNGINGAVDKVTQAITGGLILPSSESNPVVAKENNNGINSIIGFLFVAAAAFLGRTKSFWLGGVIGLIIGAIGGFIMGSWETSLIAGGVLGVLGLLFDYIFSRGGGPGAGSGNGISFGSRGSGGGFGGFGGGSSGGGGASGRW